jgi:hypothetical protein
LNAELLALYERFDKSKPPEYRGFRCGGCGKRVTKAWHVWVTAGWMQSHPVKVEVHLCRKCGRKYGLRP